MKRIMFMLWLSISTLAYAQDYNPNPQTWTIDAERITCENNDNAQCFLVKFPGKNEFEIFNESIEGFEYESGYQYTISVKQQLKTPPIKADESIFKYVLIKVINKKSINKTILPDASNSTKTNSTKSASKIIEINFETVPCGNGQKCMLVKEQGKKEFEIFDKSIYGFNYEEGNSYTLSVREAGDGNYYFASEISKKKIKSVPSTSDIKSDKSEQPVKNKGSVVTKSDNIYNSTLDGRWYLRKLKEDEISSFTTDDNVIYMDVNTFADKLSGFASCNVYDAILRSDNQTTFIIDALTQNFKSCGYTKLENMYLDRLREVNKFERKGTTLILSKDWKFIMELSSDNKVTASKYEPVIINETNIKTSSSVTIEKKPETPKVELKDENAEIKNAQMEKEKKDKEMAALQKQLEQKKKEDAEKLKKLEEENLKKQKEIEDLKKQLNEPATVVMEQKTTKKTTEAETVVKKQKEEPRVEDETNEEENIPDKKKKVNDYVITQFTQNMSSKNLPEPEFPNRPYYLDGTELVKLERAEANFAAKQKGIYRGVDLQVQVMKEESPIQFLKSNLPRFFILINDEDVDPYDVIDLCKADKIGKGRRNFTYAGKKYGGRVKDVTGKLVQLEFKKIKNGVYEILIESELQQGEYAFLPIIKSDNSLVSTNSIKANCFGIVDKE